MWYAGIDWADQHHDAVVIDEAGKRVASIRVDHSTEGLNKLIEFFHRLGNDGERPEELACFIETNRGLLITALLEAGIPVYPVNPKTVDRYRKPSGAKTDMIDAYLLAKTGRSDLEDLRRLTPDSPIIEELKMLTRDQDGLVHSQTRLVNQLIACLKEYYPSALGLFGKLHQKSALVFLEAFPTPEQALRASEDELEQALEAGSHPYPKTKATRIRAKLRLPHLRASEITVRAKSRLMLALVAQLLPLIEQIAEYDKEITRLFEMHPDSPIFASLPGAATRVAPRLLAEWGDDRERHLDAASVQALAGTSPVASQSGKYAKAHKRYACCKPLRNVMHQFARLSAQQEGWAAEYYRRKRKEGKTHTMAVRALGNQWVRIVYALWKKGETYDSTVFLQARKDHARRAA